MVNRLAPEHCEIHMRQPDRVARGIRTAGAIFLGSFTPTVVGDYLAGPSHTLPTGGAGARFGGLTVDQFQRRTSIVSYDRAALRRSLSLLEANRPILKTFLDGRTDLEWAPSAGTVVFPRLRHVADTTEFAERLLRTRDTAVVPGRFFQAPAHVRIGFGGPTQTVREGLEVLTQALDEIGAV